MKKVLINYGTVTVKRMGDIDRLVCSFGETPINEDGIRDIGNINKLSQNLKRAKETIKEYATCNKWTYFCTMTLSSEKGDRYDYKGFRKRLSKWINNYNYRNKCKIKYLLIPEFHKDGAVHFHGLLDNIPKDKLCINEHGYLDWMDYRNTFGYISLSEIRNHIAVSNYMTKYITKSLADQREYIGNHLYICSKGLKKAELIYKKEDCCLTMWRYENEYCKIIEINNKTDDFNQYIDD